MFMARVGSDRRPPMRAVAGILSLKSSKFLLGVATVACVVLSTLIAWQIYAALVQTNPAATGFANVTIAPKDSASQTSSDFIRAQASLARGRVVIDRVIDRPKLKEQLVERAGQLLANPSQTQLRAGLRAYVLNRLKVVSSRDPARLSFQIRAKDADFAQQLSNGVAQSYAEVIALGGPATLREITAAQNADRTPPKRQFIIACAFLLCIGLAVAVLVPLVKRANSEPANRRKKSRKNKGSSTMNPEKFEPYQDVIRDAQSPKRPPKPFRDDSIAEKILATGTSDVILFVDAAVTYQVPLQRHTSLIDHILATAQDLADAGKNTVIIDAAWSPDMASSDVVGLSNLIDGSADFGEILHCDFDTGMSYVPRGTGPLKMHQMPEIIDLRDALVTLFDVVLVHIGDVQAASLLTTFASSQAQIVIIEPAVADHSGNVSDWSKSEQKFEQDIWLEAGFAAVHVVADPEATTRRNQHAQRQQLTELQRRERMIKPAPRRRASQKPTRAKQPNAGRARHG